jgi:hypothetical protein
LSISPRNADSDQPAANPRLAPAAAVVDDAAGDVELSRLEAPEQEYQEEA